MSMDSSTKARDQDEAQATLCDEAVYKSYSDINSDLHTSNKPRLSSYIPRSRLHRFLVIPFILSLLLIPLVYVISINTRTSYKQCGTTADEARARGCVFETTGFTWLPKECHDQDTEEEFLEFITSHKINLYRDTNMTDIVTVEEVREGNGPGCMYRAFASPFFSPYPLRFASSSLPSPITTALLTTTLISLGKTTIPQHTLPVPAQEVTPHDG
jgi:hypothetical protein